MNGEARPEAGATDDNQADGSTTVTELLDAIRQEMADALAEPDCPDSDRAFWAIVSAGLNGSLSWDQVANATRTIEQQPAGRCPFCGCFALVEKDSGVADLYVCGECHRIWPFPVTYRLPAWRLREILGETDPEVAS